MDLVNAAASAAVGAVVAIATTLVMDHLKKEKDTKEHELELSFASQDGHTRGWYEGRESIMQQFQQNLTTPEVFSK